MHARKFYDGESHEGEHHAGQIIADNLTLGTGMPESPTREDIIPERSFWRVPWFKSPCRRVPRWRRMGKAVTESPCRKVSRSWGQPDQRAPRGRTPCRRDYSRKCHDSENPAGEFRDGEDHFWRVARCMRSSRRVPRWSRQLPERPHTRSPAVEESIMENPSKESHDGEDHVTGTIQR